MVRPLPGGSAEMGIAFCILCAGSGCIAASGSENGGDWYPLQIVSLSAIILWNLCMQSPLAIRAE